MIEVFKTSIAEPRIAEEVVRLLESLFPDAEINFDLEDCDKILRIDSKHLIPQRITDVLVNRGHFCERLE